MTRTTFQLEGKALTATPLQSGDLLLEGYCVVYDGIDADGENFLKGALRDAIPPALRAGLPLAYHHDRKTILGRVLSLTEDAYGVKMTARVDRQEKWSPLYHLYEKIRRGTIRGLSVSGYFQRADTPGGRMIDKVLRLVEVSVTGAAAHPRTLANAVEVKAIMNAADDHVALARTGLALLGLEARCRQVEARVELAGLARERDRLG